MQEILSPLSQRINYIVNTFEGGVQRRFALKIGARPGQISEVLGERKAKPSSDLLEKIGKAYPEISTAWLLLGEGEMLKSVNANAQAENSASYTPDQNATPINILSNIPTVWLRRLPFKGRASFNYQQFQQRRDTDFLDDVLFRIPKGRTPEDYTDAMVIDIEGDSMEKSLYDGQSVIAWPIPESKWEHLHNTICFIDYDDTATVKAVLKNDLFNTDSLTLVATGGHGGSFTVARASIHSLWEVREFYDPQKVRLVL